MICKGKREVASGQRRGGRLRSEVKSTTLPKPENRPVGCLAPQSPNANQTIYSSSSLRRPPRASVALGEEQYGRPPAKHRQIPSSPPMPQMI